MSVNGSPSMRVAVLSLHSSPTGALGTRDTGGMSVYVREVAGWMGRSGHCVDIFTCVPGPIAPVTLDPNVRLIHLRVAGRPAIAKEGLFEHIPAAAEAIAAFALDHRVTYDVIHSHYWLSAVAGDILRKRWCCPHLVMFHTLGWVKNRTTIGEAEPELRIFHERRAMETAHGIVVPSATERRHLLEAYDAAPQKIRTIPCGVNLERFRPVEKTYARQTLGLPPQADVILFVGRFAPVKGLTSLLDAAAALVPRFPGLALVVVGGDGAASGSARELMDQAKQLGIDTRVTFAGRIDHDDLPLYYGAADLLASPSTYESFGLVTLESLACGTPVAVTQVGAAPAVIKEAVNGTLIHGTDAASVSQGIERLLHGVKSRRMPPERIRDTVLDYGWDSIAASVLKVYEALVDAHGGLG